MPRLQVLECGRFHRRVPERRRREYKVVLESQVPNIPVGARTRGVGAERFPKADGNARPLHNPLVARGIWGAVVCADLLPRVSISCQK